MSFFGGGGSSAPTPPLPKIEEAPPPAIMPSSKPKAKSKQTTFLGMDVTPGPASGNSGGKTLLGM
jgi:hypothetical protein